VPSAGTGGQGSTRGQPQAAALHAAAQCIRRHGIPGYVDPVLTPSGQVYTDQRSFQDASQATLAAVTHACGTLVTLANFDPSSEPPAPPQLVQAGVRTAECMRAHGLPNVTDPTARTSYAPGHGFGLTAREMPAGGKASPVWRRTYAACSSVIAAELRTSTLASLGSNG
jgi:hypothetical protein